MPKDLNTQTHTHGGYTQRTLQTGHKDKMPGRQDKSRWTGVAQIVHLSAVLDFTLVNSPNSSCPYGLLQAKCQKWQLK